MFTRHSWNPGWVGWQAFLAHGDADGDADGGGCCFHQTFGQECPRRHRSTRLTKGSKAVCCVVMFYLFSPCASYILSIDVVYRLPVCKHCITSNDNQVCALLGLPREKPWMVPSLFSRPKPKPSQLAVAHCIPTCGYSPRSASREIGASWQHHDAAHCRCILQDST